MRWRAYLLMRRVSRCVLLKDASCFTFYLIVQGVNDVALTLLLALFIVCCFV